MKNLSKSKNYQNAQAYTQAEKLPVGAYKLKILDVKYIDNSAKGYSNQIVLSFDIAEGEHKDFYKHRWEADKGNEDRKWKGTYRFYEPADDGSERDEWSQRRLKTIVAAFEDSNDGYHWNWDEQSLKGLFVGAIFNEKEYEFNGRHGFFTNCYSLIPVGDIDTAKIPEPTRLKNRQSSDIGDGFMDVDDSVEDDGIPF